MQDPARRRSDGTMSPSLTQNGSSEARGSMLELSGIPMLHRKGARPPETKYRRKAAKRCQRRAESGHSSWPKLEGVARYTQRDDEQINWPADLATVDTTEPFEIVNAHDFNVFCIAVQTAPAVGQRTQLFRRRTGRVDRGAGHEPRARRALPPQTQGKIERWHQALKNRMLLENYFLPGDLERQIEAFIEHYNHRRALHSSGHG
jgi:transposase InsO family protein